MNSKILIIIIYTIVFTFVNAVDLGKFSLQPGLSSKLYNPNYGEDFDEDKWFAQMATYFRSFKYLDTCTLLSSATGVTDPKFYYKENEATTVLGNVIPSGLNQFVVAMRGFFKAPASGKLTGIIVANTERDSDGNMIESNGLAAFNMSLGVYLIPDGDTISCNELPLTTRAFFGLAFYNFYSSLTEEYHASTSNVMTEGHIYPIVINVANLDALVNISTYTFIVDGVEYPLSGENLFTLNLEESSWADTDLRVFPNRCPIYSSNTIYTGAQVTGTTTTATSLTTYTDSYGMYVTETIYIVATPAEVPTSSSSTEEIQSSSTQYEGSSKSEVESSSSSSSSTEYLQSSSTSSEGSSLTEYISSSTTNSVTIISSISEESSSNTYDSSSSFFSILDSSSTELQESTSTLHSETISTSSNIVSSVTSCGSPSSISSETFQPDSSISSFSDTDDISSSGASTVIESSTDITYTETDNIDSKTESSLGISTMSSSILLTTSTYDLTTSESNEYNTVSTSMETTYIGVDTDETTATDIGPTSTSDAKSDISSPNPLSTFDSFTNSRSYTSDTLYGSSIDVVTTENIMTDATILETISVHSSTTETINSPSNIVSSKNTGPADIESIHTETVIVSVTTNSHDVTQSIINTAVTCGACNSELQNNDEMEIQSKNDLDKSTS